jgi:hypothetical protein
MKTKFKIIETPYYILAVSDEEIKEGDLCSYNKSHNSRNPDWELIICGVIEREEMHPYSNGKLLLWMKKIIAYHRKNSAPELDLPSLPECEDDVVTLSQNATKNQKFANGLREEQIAQIYFRRGYKAATKVYSEEDLRKAIEIARDMKYITYSEDEIISTVNQPKTPKWFVAENNEKCKCGVNCEFEICKHESKLKTTTINSKTYLIGYYEK